MAVSVSRPRRTKVPEIRKGDTVLVLTGKDAGKRGLVERVLRARTGSPRRTRRPAAPGATWIVVEGLNVAKRHTKARPPRPDQAGRMPKAQQGGILDIAQPIPAANVMVVCSHCGRPTRIGHAFIETAQGEKVSVRVCRRCGEQLEVTTE